MPKWIPGSQAITANMFRDLEKENNELADELSYMVYQLAETFIKLEKACSLANITPDSITVDEVEIIEILEHHNPLNH